MSSIRVYITAFVTAAALSVALAGCSVSTANETTVPEATETTTAPDSGQTVAEACVLLQSAASTLQTSLSDSASTVTTDPAGAVAVITQAATDFDAAVDEISNDEAHGVAETASESLLAYAAALEAVLADPATGAEGLTGAITDMQTDVSAVGTMCAAG